MQAVTLYHNPRCTKSRQALAIAQAPETATSFDLDVVKYLDHPPTEEALRDIVAKLEDEPSKLVRRDNWADLGITADDVATPAGVIDVLVRHPALMERPVIVTADRAFIGRPTERVSEFFAS